MTGAAEDAIAELCAARDLLDRALRGVQAALTAPSRGDITGLMEQIAIPVSFGAPAATTASRTDTERLQREVSELRQRAETAEAEVARMTAEFDAAIDELRAEHVAVLRDQATTYASLPLDELLTIFAALRRSITTREVLATLLSGITREYPRAALFSVNGTALEGVEQRGFEGAADISTIAIPLSGDSLLARAARSGQVESFFPGVQDTASCGTPFGAVPPSALAIPIVCRGETVAIIYADDPDAPEFATNVPQTRAKFAELLHQHALLVLAKLSSDEQASRGRQQHAAALVAQLERAHGRWMEAGRTPLERQRELRVGIERARGLLGKHGPNPDDTAIDGCLANAAQTGTPFGDDVAVVIGTRPRGRAAVVQIRR